MKSENWKKAFNQGFACACATMMREHDEPTMVEDCYKSNFMNLKQLKQNKVDPFDIEILKPIIKEIERKNK